MKRIGALLGILVLTGCVSATVEDVSPRYKTFAVPRSYQAVFRDLLVYSRSCYRHGPPGRQQPVDAELDVDKHRGDIFVATLRDRTVIPILAIAITGSGQHASVTVTDLSPLEFDTVMAHVQGAAEGKPVQC